ncbi:MAG: 3-deoxy-D-manno-octulosonic acid transferase [bacterium]|nr:3-deoxy-D-manno-octulosonic acid transferase [bacterium]
MKWFVYNCLFAVAYLAMMPSFLLRMKRRGGYKARMGDRFGRYPEGIRNALASRETRPIWIHAVSVGEVQVAGQLMRALRERDQTVRFVFSTTSSTGWKTAENELARLAKDGLGRADDVLIYNPLDFNGCVRRALDLVNPRAVILTETEIWPNFIRAIRRRGIPLYLVNARISDHSAPRYRALRWFFGEVFRSFTKIYVQSDLDARRLVDAGANADDMVVTGSFKFDVAHRNPVKEQELAAWIAAGSAPILLGGSTWPGEDEVLLRIYSQLVKKHPEVRLVIAPRHFEKADAVEANIRAAGFGCIRRSRGESPQPPQPSLPVFLCDTTGEMMGLFGISTVAFVGKSLCAHGSQNMIEPCLCGKPTVVGPYTENFRPVMSDLLAADAIVQVPNEAALKAEIFRFFDDPAARAAQGERATAAVERRCGVVGRCADELLEALR